MLQQRQSLACTNGILFRKSCTVGPKGINWSSQRRLLSTRAIGARSVKVYAQLQLSSSEASYGSVEELVIPHVSETESSSSTLPSLWPSLAERFPDHLALLDPHAPVPSRYTFSELSESISTFASGLTSLGLAPGDRVSLFSENSSRWLIADQGIQKCGAVDAIRGVSSTVEELSYIMQHSESTALVLQDVATLEKLAPALSSPSLRSSISFVVLLWGEPNDATVTDSLSCPVVSFSQVMERGKAAPEVKVPISTDDLSTIFYTSGTTCHPKGVQLTHGNILYQVREFPAFLKVTPGQRTLSLLPPWHVYENSCAKYILASGAAQIFTNIRHFKDDLTTYTPDHFVCVPLVLDTLRSRVMATLNKASAVRKTIALGLLSAAIAYTQARRIVDGVALQYAVHPRPVLELFKAWIVSLVLAPFNFLAQKIVASKVRAALGIKETVVSGGGSLAPHLDDFYEAISLPVLNGYGLTETSPVLACRTMQMPFGNVRGSVGRVIPGGTQIRIVDPENHYNDVPDSQQGLILARGPGVFHGYYNNPSATAGAFPIGDGWFNTGDLGWRAPEGVPGSNMAGCLVLTGRAKDTIVLSSGENVEPQPIEDALCSSPYIKFAALIGQNHRGLGALLVPDTDALTELAKSRGVESLTKSEVHDIMKSAVIAASEGRVRWEHVSTFLVLEKPFSVEDGTLTRTMKLRRAEINKVYAQEVAQLEAKLR